MRGTHRFTASITRFGTLYGVMVPAKVSRAIGVRGRVPAEVRLGRAFSVRATLIPTGSGRHSIRFNTRTREEAGATLGKRIAVVIRVDDGKRDVPIPDDLARVLHDEELGETWASMPPGKREHILDWIERAVHERTRESRIAKTIEVTHALRERRLAAAVRARPRSSRGASKRGRD
jgi:hypothetical protein